MAKDSNPDLFRQLQIDGICVQFEQRLRDDRQPRIESLLETHHEPLRSQLLKHLLLIEIEYHTALGQQPDLHDFLHRFPQDQSLIHIVFDEQSRRSRLEETELPPGRPSVSSYADSGISKSDSSLHGRFLPGTKLANRFRIVSLLGKGGMGEVYRADDLRLGQTVALKFLPKKLARDAERLERFQSEVRLTRQVSHPNVCRVYDMDEVDGHQFLSMEFVDGEDLRVLLRRIGRLPKDKGIQIAQQLCAGLGAAHDKGVLHRDLKPANIMIDGRGQVRITDFGLAKLTEDDEQDEIAGTPAYMAPEQLRSGQTSVQSDLYSLGLILYELFTGEAVNKANTIPDLLKQHEDSTPSVPSSVVDDIDPVVERAILRCLEKEPRQRPQSAHALAASLPGGDPLAAALAAGETPSPEMVAAAGRVDGIDPRISFGFLAAVAVALMLFAWLSGIANPINHAGLEKHPQVLVRDARDIIQMFGYDEKAVDTAWGLSPHDDVLWHVEDTKDFPAWADLPKAQPPQVVFWYRHSPIPIQSLKAFMGDGGVDRGEWGGISLGRVGIDDPPLSISGMINVRLDPKGRLIEFIAVPPQRPHPPEDKPVANLELKSIFGENAEEKLGFSLKSFQETESTWIPPVHCDARCAWAGSYPNGTLIRVETASFQEKLVYFHVIGEWTHARREAGTVRPANPFHIPAFLMMALASIVAVLHVRQRRGDTRGAFRLAVVAFSGELLCYVFEGHHVLSITELLSFQAATAWSLFVAADSWLKYVAIEPFVRRIWPNLLISWSRLLAGRLRDPLVGHHLLVGALVGTLVHILWITLSLMAVRHGKPPTYQNPVEALQGTQSIIAEIVAAPIGAIQISLLGVMWLLILKVVFRSQLLAAVAFVALFMTIFVPGPWNMEKVILSTFFFAVVMTVLIRCGLLAYVTLNTVFELLLFLPVTSDSSAWYFGTGIAGLSVVFAIAAFGCSTSLGRKPVFG